MVMAFTIPTTAPKFQPQYLCNCRQRILPSISSKSRASTLSFPSIQSQRSSWKWACSSGDSNTCSSDSGGCLVNIRTAYNDISIVEVPPGDPDSPIAGSRILVLDDSNNIHSIYRRDQKLTNLYWDEFATLPGIIPEGPIAILGLGGGTAAHLMLELWPSLKIEGWEIDQVLVDKARLFLGLSEPEKPTKSGGYLKIHVGDALSPSATVPKSFAGIVVDLFSGGRVLWELQKTETWLNMKKRLQPGGRIMINCGGACVESRDPDGNIESGTWTWEDGGAIKDATLDALSKAFPRHLSWKKMDSESGNYMALTGSPPDLNSWAATIPECIRARVFAWKPYESSPFDRYFAPRSLNANTY